MKITILGSGTSQGVPVIGCDCDVCHSDDFRDRRLRSGVLIEVGDVNILIDTGPDLRYQMLKNNIESVHAILYTHEHNDHIIGLDDIRPFNFKQKVDMPLFAMPRVADELLNRFGYVFATHQYPGAPRATMNRIVNFEPINVLGIEVQPFEVIHGSLPILGYRIGDFTFITDASSIPAESIPIIEGTKVMVVNALRKIAHHSHFTLNQAQEFIELINPERAYVTHLSHLMGKTKDWEKELDKNVFPAYDGLELTM